ncbi:MAG TPA: type I restriction-modification enzyme R subunit C-terminal domain-containing protein, partial [Syntrophales bacterium]|nr:type I restriction-modification enzyme R subunit C-terminal domain-containing protein [Syntrophales bacterium]
HKEVENLVMLRPTRSAIKYAQMRGRGSRLCPRIGKTEFLIYDFVGNTDNFNDPGIKYHKPKEVGVRPGSTQPGEPEPGPEPKPQPYPEPKDPREFFVIDEGSMEDEFRERKTIIVGPEGLAMDQKAYQQKWADRILELHRTDPAVQKIFSGKELTEEEWESLDRRLNSPEYYFNEKTLRKAFEQPTGSLSDFIRAALGQYRFPSRDERIRSIFNTWVAEHSDSIKPDHAQMLRLLESRVLAGDTIEMRLFSLPPFSLWGGRVRMEQIFGRENLAQIVEELNMLLAA